MKAKFRPKPGQKTVPSVFQDVEDQADEAKVREAAAQEPRPAPKPAARYVLAKKYSPKTERNQETWDKIMAALADGPKTLQELTAAVETHKDFVGYMVRGGHIAPAATT